MNASLLSWLRCPFCGGNFHGSETNHIADDPGYDVLTCYCGRYPIVAGISILKKGDVGTDGQTADEVIALIETGHHPEAECLSSNVLVDLKHGRRTPEIERLIKQCVVLGMPERYRAFWMFFIALLEFYSRFGINPRTSNTSCDIVFPLARQFKELAVLVESSV